MLPITPTDHGKRAAWDELIRSRSRSRSAALGFQSGAWGSGSRAGRQGSEWARSSGLEVESRRLAAGGQVWRQERQLRFVEILCGFRLNSSRWRGTRSWDMFVAPCHWKTLRGGIEVINSISAFLAAVMYVVWVQIWRIRYIRRGRGTVASTIPFRS